VDARIIYSASIAATSVHHFASSHRPEALCRTEGSGQSRPHSQPGDCLLSFFAFFYPFLLPRGGEMNQVEGASGCESIHRDAACLPGKRNAAKIDNEVVSFRRPQQPEHCFFFPPFFPLHTHLRLIADAGPA